MLDDNFIMCSPEVIQDKRLSLNQIKVLLALFSFRNKATNLCFPSRNSIAEKTGIRITTVSEVTTELVSLQWVSKKWHDSKYKYELTVPDTELRAMTWTEYKEHSDPSTTNRTVRGNRTVHPDRTEIVRGNRTHNRDNLTELIIKPPNPQFPDWLDLETWDEFRKHRKKNKKPMTEYAEKLMLNKLGKLKDEGHAPNQLLETALMNGWQGIVVPDDKKAIQTQTKFPSHFERVQKGNSHLKESLEKDARDRESINDSIDGIFRKLPSSSN